MDLTSELDESVEHDPAEGSHVEDGVVEHPTADDFGHARTLPADRTWFKRAVFYEVLVRAFYDSSSDGSGDLRGLIERLKVRFDGDEARRLMRLAHGASPQLARHEREHAMRVGEMVQLANISRDVEKDLQRGVAYDTGLRPYLGRQVTAADGALVEQCRVVREKWLRLALTRVPSYARIIDALDLPRYSIARASAVLMLLFTERYFRECARRVGIEPWHGPSSILALFARAIATAFSAARARTEIARVQEAFLTTAQGIGATRAPAGVPNVSYARIPT
mgnify:CR=1 FL=1